MSRKSFNDYPLYGIQWFSQFCCGILLLGGHLTLEFPFQMIFACWGSTYYSSLLFLYDNKFLFSLKKMQITRCMKHLLYMQISPIFWWSMIEANSSLQMVFGAGRHGIVYMWDLRGGRAPSAFQIHKEVSSWACILTC